MNWNTVTITVFGKTLTGTQAAAILGGTCCFGLLVLVVAIGVTAILMRPRE